MAFHIEEVLTIEAEEAFLRLPILLYKGNPYWVRPLDNDIRNVFNPEKNPCFKEGELVRYLLRDDNGRIVGRVAAFINAQTAHIGPYSVGQMGFFECIRDEQAAFMLFDACKSWLEARGMEAIEGPVNFGERMQWWGLLHDGFDEHPVYAMPYTHDYYVKFFEDWGFRDYFQQYTFRSRLVVESLSPVVVWKADRILKNPDYSVKTYREIGRTLAIDSLLSIYNKTWSLDVHGVNAITRDEVEAIYKSLRPIIDEDLIYYTFYKEEPIGFFLMFPEINQVVRRVKGSMTSPIGLMTFLRFRKKIDVALGQLFGVVPEFQGKGVEATMIKALCDRVAKGSRYRYLELNWVGDFNPPMLHLMEYLSAKRVRTHVTYRKILREGIPFYRSVDKAEEA